MTDYSESREARDEEMYKDSDKAAREKERVITEVTQDGLALENVSYHLKRNPEVVLRAIVQNPNARRYSKMENPTIEEFIREKLIQPTLLERKDMELVRQAAALLGISGGRKTKRKRKTKRNMSKRKSIKLKWY